MLKKSIKIILTVAIGGFFLWLAFRNVEIEKVWRHIKNISFGWILPFAGVVLLSNFIRSERWRLLIEHEKEDISGITLVSGVLTGYFFNMITPRLGEVSRPVYVARREDLSSSKMFGTIVLERIIDLTTLILLLVGVFVYLIADYALLEQIFGASTLDFFTEGIGLSTTLNILIWVAILLAAGFLSIKGVQLLASRVEKVNDWIETLKDFYIKFKDGLLSIKEVDRWWLFIGYTALLWLCYTLMTWIPFHMFNMVDVYNLSLLDALTITVISAIGISIPSPGGIGTYHYFVKQALLVLFAVPAVTGLAYATVTHAATGLLVILYTPIALGFDKWIHAKRGVQPA